MKFQWDGGDLGIGEGGLGCRGVMEFGLKISDMDPVTKVDIVKRQIRIYKIVN